jgi:hypothetical protein
MIEVLQITKNLPTATSGNANGWCTFGWIWREGTSGYTAPARELGTELWWF